MINYTCHVTVRELLCGYPLTQVPNHDPLTKDYFDLLVCDAGHRVLFIKSRNTQSNPKKDEPRSRQHRP